MNISTKLSLVILILSFKSCNTNKTVVGENSKEESIISKQVNETLINEGYSIGTMQYVSDSSCAYIIIDEKTQTKFDPINIEEKRFTVYREHSIHIYYKYRRLRMPHRCNDIQPIELIDIKKEKN